MRTTTETRLSRLETAAATNVRRVRVFFCTVRAGRCDADMREALAALGEEPADDDVLFLTTYEGRDGVLPDVTPRASVGRGW